MYKLKEIALKCKQKTYRKSHSITKITENSLETEENFVRKIGRVELIVRNELHAHYMEFSQIHIIS